MKVSGVLIILLVGLFCGARAFAAVRPPLDNEIPKTVQTASFALG